jgi:hypothetical protein
MNLHELVVDASARRAGLYHYAQAHDAWSELEQVLTGQGRTIEAEGAHVYALRILRAYRAELDDPEPREDA